MLVVFFVPVHEGVKITMGLDERIIFLKKK